MGPRVWVFMMQACESMWLRSTAIRARRLIRAGMVVVTIKYQGRGGGRQVSETVTATQHCDSQLCGQLEFRGYRARRKYMNGCILEAGRIHIHRYASLFSGVRV